MKRPAYDCNLHLFSSTTSSSNPVWWRRDPSDLERFLWRLLRPTALRASRIASSGETKRTRFGSEWSARLRIQIAQESM